MRCSSALLGINADALTLPQASANDKASALPWRERSSRRIYWGIEPPLRSAAPGHRSAGK